MKTALLLSVLLVAPVQARDNGQWNGDPDTKKWYQELKQPGNNVSCCGEADAYWCDKIFTRDGKNYCTITDDRVVMNRPAVPVGTEIEIPDAKMLDGEEAHGNPTGHSVVFLSTSGYVFCFILDSGT